MIKNFGKEIKRTINKFLVNRIETVLPGVVIDITGYEDTQQIRTVQPLLNVIYDDNSVDEMGYIHNVPVELPGTQESLISVPIKVGDTVRLVFSKRSMDELKDMIEASPHTPPDRRRFDTSDAIAYPVVLNRPNNLNPHPDNTEIKFLSHLFSMRPDGQFFQNNGNVQVQYDQDGAITITNPNSTLTVNPSGTFNFTQGSTSLEVSSSGQISGINSLGNFTLQSGGSMIINGCTINTSGNVITASGTNLDALRNAYNGHTHTEQGDGQDTSGPSSTV